ncbi:hypothetical protein ACMHYO_16240 [Allopusillimonas ginsengisoli]|uniref:DUF7940 domain-containing protein n=1 Tax=Allopusillimonas ginsengisoli TaxID=453575 RepID=UPI0039C2ED64
MKLVHDWKDWPKWTSTWFEAAAVAFFSTIILAPEVILQVWAVIPDELRSEIPQSWLKWIGVVLIVGGSIAKLIEQPWLGCKGREK